MRDLPATAFRRLLLAEDQNSFCFRNGIQPTDGDPSHSRLSSVRAHVIGGVDMVVWWEGFAPMPGKAGWKSAGKRTRAKPFGLRWMLPEQIQ